MEIADTMAFGQAVVKLGLVDQGQLNGRRGSTRRARVPARRSPKLPYLTRALERKGFLTNYQTSKVLKGDTDGYFLGGYRILYKISSGSFGRVFRDDPRRRAGGGDQGAAATVERGSAADRPVHPRAGGADSQAPQHRRSDRHQPGSRHPPVLHRHGVRRGRNLREILQIRKTLAVPESLKIIEDAASGLAYAYSRGITHRDIKLTNLLISSQGEAKLVDFGLAQMFAALGKADEQVDRTVDYAGLEKATGVKSGDVRSDIFFLGCVFYEMLTGRPPLEMTKDRHARMQARRFMDVESLTQGEINAPAAVYGLCDSMMAFDPQRQLQTPSQLVDAVKAARRDVGGGATAAAAGSKNGASKTIFLVEANQRLQEAAHASSSASWAIACCSPLTRSALSTASASSPTRR
ncbi:MAG: protein kinase [Gemmataceae bacterium]